MIALSVAERLDFVLVPDEGVYYQAWWEIGHGYWNAYDTEFGYSFLKINGELIDWPLAVLFRPILSQTSFLILEDLFLVGAAAVGLIWLLEIVRRPSWPARFPPWLAVATYLLLIVVNPWMFQTIAWAWHLEPLDVLILVLAAYFVEHRHWKRAAVFVVLAMLTGDTGAVLLGGLGVAIFLCGRRWRWTGIAIFVAGVLTLFVLNHLGLTGSSNQFRNLVGSSAAPATRQNVAVTQIATQLLRHPSGLIGKLWQNRLNFYANLGPSGLIGILSPWGFGVPVSSLAVSGLAGNQSLRVPGFQNAAVYVFATFGTILVLRRVALIRRIPRSVTFGLTGLVAVNAVLWGAVWIPKIPNEWVRISRPAAAVLRQASETIPSNAEVVASEGITGSFSQRRYIYQFHRNGYYPVKARPVYFVITPVQGIEAKDVTDALSGIDYVANDLHAKLVAEAQGAWFFRWVPPKSQKSFRIPVDLVRIPAWTTPGTAGYAARSGPSANWFVGSNGRSGYVVSGDYWRRGLGHYEANVTLSANIPVKIEVWNATSKTLLARTDILPTQSVRNISLPVDVAHLAPPQAETVAGSALFKVAPEFPTPGNSIEIRVWTPGKGGVSVYQLGLRALAGAHN